MNNRNTIIIVTVACILAVVALVINSMPASAEEHVPRWAEAIIAEFPILDQDQDNAFRAWQSNEHDYWSTICKKASFYTLLSDNDIGDYSAKLRRAERYLQDQHGKTVEEACMAAEALEGSTSLE